MTAAHTGRRSSAPSSRAPTSARSRRPGRWARSSPATPRRPRSPGSRSRCAPRARRSTRSPGLAAAMLAPRAARSRCPAGCSTSSAPAATARCRSTSPRWPRSSRPAPARRVVKHGNRSASSKSGSADVLEALGIRLDLPARAGGRGGRARRASRSASPPRFHPAMRYAAVPAPRARRSRTTFNFLGPLANPARPERPGDRLRRPADGAGDGRGASRGAASTRGCSAATTGSTS